MSGALFVVKNCLCSTKMIHQRSVPKRLLLSVLACFSTSTTEMRLRMNLKVFEETNANGELLLKFLKRCIKQNWEIARKWGDSQTRQVAIIKA